MVNRPLLVLTEPDKLAAPLCRTRLVLLTETSTGGIVVSPPPDRNKMELAGITVFSGMEFDQYDPITGNELLVNPAANNPEADDFLIHVRLPEGAGAAAGSARVSLPK